jgi:hypothetical protein
MTLEAENPEVAKSGGAKEKRNSKGILCVKCGHVSPSGNTKCERCEAHLHIKCNDCGAANARSAGRCKDCGRRLHKTAFEKINKTMFNHTAKITPLQILLAIVAVGLVFFLIMFMANLRFPSLF